MNNKPVFWKQANGELISIDDMDIQHLRNVLKLIIRNNQKIPKSCPHNTTQAEDFSLNGDIANDFNNCYPGDDECDATEIDIY